MRSPDRAPRRHRGLPLRPRVSNTVPPALRLLLIKRALRHERRPIANSWAVKQQNNRNNAQRQTNEAKQTRSPLNPKLRVQSLRSQRQESAKSVAAQRRRGQRGSGVLFVGVGEVVDHCHVDLVDPQAHACDSQSRHDPVDGAVRRPSVPEHTGREDQRAGDCEVQTGFGAWLAWLFLVVLRRAEVEHVLEWIDEGPDDSATGKRKLDERRLECIEPVQLGEDLCDTALEEEEDSPCETHPEREGDDDEFGYQHFGRSLERQFQHLGHTRLVELGFGKGVATLLAQSLGPACEDHIAAGFF